LLCVFGRQQLQRATTNFRKWRRAVFWIVRHDRLIITLSGRWRILPDVSNGG
jgi:hypothetical protein